MPTGQPGLGIPKIRSLSNSIFARQWVGRRRSSWNSSSKDCHHIFVALRECCSATLVLVQVYTSTANVERSRCFDRDYHHACYKDMHIKIALWYQCHAAYPEHYKRARYPPELSSPIHSHKTLVECTSTLPTRGRGILECPYALSRHLQKHLPNRQPVYFNVTITPPPILRW